MKKVKSYGSEIKELEVGKTTVYVRSNIKPIEMNIGEDMEDTRQMYECDEIQYTKDEYLKLMTEQNRLTPVEKTLSDLIRDYRWEKQRWVQYDGYTQRFDTYDVQRMRDLSEALQEGIVTEIEWVYPVEDETVIIKDYNYLKDMMLAGYLYENKLRGIEKKVIADESVTVDNYKEKFEELL